MVRHTRRKRHRRKHTNSRRARGVSLSKDLPDVNRIRNWCFEFSNIIVKHESILDDLTDDTKSLCTTTLTNKGLDTFKIKCLATLKHLKENIGVLERKFDNI